VSILYERHKDFPESILIRRFVDEVDVNKIIDSWKNLIESKMITDKTKGVINDLDNSKLNIDMESFKTLIRFLKEEPVLKKLKLAVVCNNPHTIVFPFLAEQEKNLMIKPFSTIENAIEWINEN
jgi:predicted HAD superfamily phosphohydrolase YqeG